MDTEILKYLTPMGVGGMLAGLIFFFYRKDAIQWQEAWKGQSAMILQVVKENTAAISTLIQVIEQRERRK